MSKPGLVSTFLSGALFSIITLSSVAADITHSLSHQDEAPIIDGVMDEAVWQNATRIELKYKFFPGEGTPAQVKTIAYLYEDGDSLHVAIRAFDPNPKEIRAHLVDRDNIWDEDTLGLVIDTFNDERSGYEFYVNPLGVQADVRMSDTNRWNSNRSWNAIWSSAAKITEDGWVAEMSIPFKALRFPVSDGELTWSIALFRRYPRDVNHQLTSYKRDFSIKCNLCQFDKIKGFASIKAGKNFQLTPTLTLGRNDSKEDVPGDWENGDADTQAGISLRWGVTQSMVLNATLNPDFSQVEADDAQLSVNNTFSLFTPEKRPFFLDGADYFVIDDFNFVHTRNIADPDYGVKLTGKNGSHSYGVLLANDNATAFLLPGNQSSKVAKLTFDADDGSGDEIAIGSQDAIARYKMDVGERNSIGGLITNRTASDYQSTLGAIDGNFWFNKEDSLRFQMAYSSSKNPEAIQDEYDLARNQNDYAFQFKYAHNTRDYRLVVEYRDVGKDFRSDMGFTNKADYKLLSLGGNYNTFADEGADSLVTNSRYDFRWNLTYDQDGNKLTDEIRLFARHNAIFQSHIRLGAINRKRFYQNDFNEPGEFFTERLGIAFVRFSPMAGVNLRFFTRAGNQIDFANGQAANGYNVRATVDVRLGKHFNIDVTQNYNTLTVRANDHVLDGNLVRFGSGTLFTANQTDLRLSYQFNIRSQLKLVIQYTNVVKNPNLYRANFDNDDDNNVGAIKKDFATQLIYSYKLNPQSLFYMGYSDSGFQDDDLKHIERDERSIFAKISYAWQS